MIARLAALLLALFAVPLPCLAEDAGRFVEIPAVPSVNIAPPHVVVWLPPGYESSNRRYGTVYMHDGQNLALHAGGGCGWTMAPKRSTRTTRRIRR